MVRTLILLLALGCGSAPKPAAPPAPTTLAPLALPDLLAERPGRPRLINFWATWCGPCVQELPALSAFAARHPDVEVVLVNVDTPNLHEPKVLPMIQQRALGVRHLMLTSNNPDADLTARVPGWVHELPYTMLYAPDGALRRTWSTAIDVGEVEQLLYGGAN